MSAHVVHADCLAALRDMPDASVDAVVTDPPYGLSNTTPAQVSETITRWVSGDREYLPSARGFMGHEWDGFVPPVAVWDECLRVLKPGGHLLAFAGSRTHDLMTLGIRLAGFGIRDSIAWLHAQGFPKAKSQLKPAFEPVTLARKPLTGTVAANVLEYGTGALNIDATRIQYASESDRDQTRVPQPVQHNDAHAVYQMGTGQGRNGETFTPAPAGRWPANVVLDESQAAELDRQSGNVKTGATKPHRRDPDSSPMFKVGKWMTHSQPASEGGASRFFKVIEHDAPFMYCAKAPKSERPVVDGVAHSTVKPVTLMKWLVRMVTPPGGTVLDPFAGSGTTLEAAMLEGFNVIGVEREADYLPLIQARIERATAELEARAEAEGDTLFPIDGSAS